MATKKKSLGNKRTTQKGSNLSKEQRRKQILDAAKEVFSKRGYARTTVDDIVGHAGVARGTFYLYFGDKRDVFSELMDGFAAHIGGAIIRIDTSDSARGVEPQILGNIRAIVSACLSERALTKILFTDAVGIDPDFESRIGRFYDELVKLLTESLREGQLLGVVADGEARVFAFLTIGALKELLFQAVTLGLGSESAEALSAQMFTFLGSGYLRTAPADRPRRTKAPSA